MSAFADSPVGLAVQGTAFGWFMTALGAAMVIPLELFQLSPERTQQVMDAALGFSVGVMLAASYFSLLAPAIDEAALLFPSHPNANWIVATIGFLCGGLVLYLMDVYLPDDFVASLAPAGAETQNVEKNTALKHGGHSSPGAPKGAKDDSENKKSGGKRRASRSPAGRGSGKSGNLPAADSTGESGAGGKKSWKRIVLLVIAISLHNAPEGGAVGVAFGGLKTDINGSALGGDDAGGAERCEAVGCGAPSGGMTFAGAVSVAIGIGLQNFPEGLAVSLPLRREGCSLRTALWWGQLSGLVEVVFGFAGAYAVSYAKFILPGFLAAAAGAMIYVCVAELIPEAVLNGNKGAVNAGVMLGFALMMSMDVALG